MHNFDKKLERLNECYCIELVNYMEKSYFMQILEERKPFCNSRGYGDFLRR